MGFDYIVCDSPAGIETGALMAMHFADEALVVTNPEVSSVRDSDRILGMLARKTKRAIEGRRADQGAPADHALQPEPRGRRPDAVARRHPGHPAHQADRRDPGIGERAAGLQPGRAGDPHQGHRRGRGLQGRGGALPRRRQADALRRCRRSRASSSACSAGGKAMSLLSFLLGEKKKTASVAKERLQIILAHERSAPAARAPDYLPALQRELVGGDLEVRVDQARGHQGPPASGRTTSRCSR